MNDLLKIIAFATAASGAVVAVKGFVDEVDSVEKKGLTLVSGITLIGLGALTIARIREAEKQAVALLA